MSLSRRVRGFTILEILVVVAIIGILAAIAFPMLAAGLERSRRATCVSNLRQLGAAAAIYRQNWDGLLPTEYLADVLSGQGHVNPAILRCPLDTANKPSDYLDQRRDNPASKMTSYTWAGPILSAWPGVGPDRGWGNTYEQRLTYMEDRHPTAGLVACLYHGYYTNRGVAPREVLRLGFDGSVRSVMLPPVGPHLFDLVECLWWTRNWPVSGWPPRGGPDEILTRGK